MENVFMGVVSLYFILKGTYFILHKLDKLERIYDEWNWINILNEKEEE